MKTTAEKSSHTSQTANPVKSGKPFFAKVGGEGFFAPVKHSAPATIQAKLAVNKPGDKYEQEADSVADRVMRTSVSGEKGKPPSTLPDKRIQRKETVTTETEEQPDYRSRESGQTATTETESAIRNKTSGGQPLSGELRKFMEPRFGNDFSNVRVHHDVDAARLNQNLNARAFTHQNHIFFGQDQFRPESQQGKHLLAHELTHVVQQGASKSREPEQPKEQTSETIQAKPSPTGSQVIQRGIMDVVTAGAGAVAAVFDRIVSNVSRAIGTGITAATSWIQGIAGRIGAGVANAWTFINNVANRIGSGLQASWNFIQGIASRINGAVTSAWGWIQNVAARIGMGITAAWSWVQRIASRLGIADTTAWAWIESLASRIGHTMTQAWFWIENVATRTGRALTMAWSWVQQMAGLVKLAVTSAWNWVQSMANRVGMMVSGAWSWILNLASQLRMAITTAWNWLLVIASRIGIVVTSAWNFLVSVATRIAETVQRAWQIVQQMASSLRMAITAAWNWALAMAGRIGLAIVSAWNRIVNIARQIRKAVTAAWGWIQSVALRIGRGILSAWNFIRNLAIRLGRGFVAAWNFLVNIALHLVKGILQTFNMLLRIARRLGRSLAEAWDWYLHAPGIDIETAIPAPDGSGRSRNKIGVGEKVTFTGSKTGDWKATAGSPLTQTSGLVFLWTAPERGTSVTISLTSGRYTKTLVISVLEPNLITTKKIREYTYSRRRMGAGMELNFIYHPKTVSFGNIETKEVSGPASNQRGYFRNDGLTHYHNSGDTFFPVKNDNVNTETDSASIQGYDPPWREGGFDWKIPNHFKLKSEAGDGKKFTVVTQSFVLAGVDGTTRISKGGEDVERTP